MSAQGPVSGHAESLDLSSPVTGAAGGEYLVVVGVSDTTRSPVALAWAASQATRFGGRVMAVRAIQTVASGPSVRPSGITHDDATEEAAALERLQADVADVLGEGHRVECRIVRGGRVKTLVEAAEDADLLVVDAPRPTHLLGGPLFAHRLVYRASCPVVVMPPGISAEPPTWLERATRALGRDLVFAAGTSARPGLMLPHHPEGS